MLGELTEADLREIGLSRSAGAGGCSAHRRAARPAAGPRLPPPAGERRQLTVMFVDLVGFTAWRPTGTPRILRDIISSYSRCCAEVVERHGGTVAKYLGDGVLAYFGYPRAGRACGGARGARRARR